LKGSDINLIAECALPPNDPAETELTIAVINQKRPFRRRRTSA